MNYFIRIFLLCSLVVFVGCSDDLVDYDKNNLVEDLEEYSFKPKIPKLLPFEPKDTSIVTESLGGADEINLLAITFNSQNDQEITYRASKGENAFDFTDEEVQIDQEIEGRYGEQGGKKLLRWRQNQIHYELQADSDLVTKKELIEVAKNVYQVEE